MRSKRRRSFRGDVSIELHIFAPDTSDPPSAPKSVKRYLDALIGIVYADDSQVGHLFVRRFAPDHPYVRRAAANGMRVTRELRDAPSVYMTVTPLRLYVADYDRAFAMRDQLSSGIAQWDLESDAAAFFEQSFDNSDDDQLEELLGERRDDAYGRGLYDSRNPELAATMRGFREQRIAELQSKLVLDQRPDRYDRPGPDLAARDAQLVAELGPLHTEDWRRLELPGTTWLPLPPVRRRDPGEPKWEDIVREHMRRHRSKWAILPAAFERPLALDIAIYRADTNARDIDNVAHTILATFEDLYCREQRGTVVAYRAYRCASSEAGIRVHLMPNERLEQLDTAISTARDLVLRTGPQDRDW